LFPKIDSGVRVVKIDFAFFGMARTGGIQALTPAIPAFSLVHAGAEAF